MKDLLRSFDIHSADRDLLELLLEEEQLAPAHAIPLLKRNCLSIAPLSFGQARLWFFDQLEPGSTSYNMPGGLRIEGALSIRGLDGVLLEIVRRHESLRTEFKNIAGAPQQVVEPAESVRTHICRYVPILVDLSELEKSEQADVARRLATGEATRSFDLSKAPLYRTSVIRLDHCHHLFLITMHHVISDEWSLSILMKELGALYDCFVSGTPSEFEDHLIQYSDFAVWQREWFREDTLRSEAEFWKSVLVGAPSSVELPVDHPRAATSALSGGELTRELPPATSLSLREIARRRGVTLFTLLLAAYEVLLFRYTGQEDFVVGTPVAGREQIEVQELIGFFVNMLAIRARLDAALSFSQILELIRDDLMAAYANQSMPFDLLVEMLQPEREPGQSSIFNTTFAVEQGLPATVRIGALDAAPIYTETTAAKFDLTVSFIDSSPGLTTRIEYSSALFDLQTIERMMGNFHVLLDAIAAGSNESISSLALLTAAERFQLLDQWNDTGADYSANLCIHRLFENQVEQKPDSVAVVFEDSLITYRTLNRRANQLGNYLRRNSIAVGSIVGICIERSLEMAVALLAIMKAGAAYLPLDPDYPVERLNYMLADSGAGLIISDSKLKNRLPEAGPRIITLDESALLLALECEDNLQITLTTENLIYLIYTSGSTGIPKGTALPHKGPLNCILWLQDKFKFGQQDRLMMKASLSFDASVWEIFWPLAVGAAVVMVVPGGEQDSSYLLNSIARLQVTSCQFVPSMLRVFIDDPNIKDASCLKLAFTLGEALPVDTMHNFLRRLSAELHNFYGPTETSMGCMDWLCQPDWDRSTVPIGRPIGNVQEYILDRQFSPVPVGVHGELYVAGEGVGFGYVGRPHLTAEKFIPDLAGRRPGERMYRTGDLCRYLHDGDIEFLGRVDHQVKIRGFRIELGEVEATLAGHPSVSECVVSARADLGQDKRLVAYFVPRPGSDVSGTSLRRFAKEKLPGFMVPAYFVQLNEWPLTANGKLDRRALPRPDSIETRQDEYSAPLGASEELLAGIWQEVLGIGRISRDANFFELGGHSLLATQVIARIRDSFRVELPLRRVFERPVFSELALAIVGETGWRADESTGAAIVRSERHGHVPLSHAQERLWFLDQLEPDRAVYNIAAGMRLQGPLSISALDQSVSEIVRRHETLRTTFEVPDGYPVQVVHSHRTCGITLVEVDGIPEPLRNDEILRIATREAGRVFDLLRGPLLRIILFRSSSDNHTLVAFMHHIVSDGWSMGIFTAELTSLYASFGGGEISLLGELEVQYSDFAAWHREYIKSERMEVQLDYWQSRLAGAAPAIDIPTDRPRPALQTYDGATAYFEMAGSLTRDLESFARRENVTRFMVLLAAFQALLHRYSGQQDISIGSPISNRTRKEIEPLIGFFANTLVLRSDLRPEEPFRELLRDVRETSLGAYAHQDLPFEMLVEALQPVRDLRHSPLFQILFVLQNAPLKDLSLPGLSVTPVPLDAGKAHFDMTLAMAEENGTLQAAIEYNTGLFDEATIRRLFGHLTVLLSAVKDDPVLRISDLPLLTDAEESELLWEFNSTAREFDRAACVHQLVERQALATPDATALVFDGSHVTYGRLDQEAESLAQLLRLAGVGPDILAGICVDRSTEMIAALLAILKAGGAYVPLDPAYPRDRLAWMMEGLQVLITYGDMAHRLPDTSARILRMSAGVSSKHLRLATSGANSTLPGNLAYVVYTSGSTGRPKGVAMSHGAAVKMICWQLGSSAQRAGGRTLQFASLSFDVSFQETISTLASGGTLLLVSDEHRKEASRLLDTVISEQIERIFLPVVALQQIAEEASNHARFPAALREVITAGERLKITGAVRSFFGELAGCALFNHYGPSETHAATAFTLPNDRHSWPEFPSIGTAIDNTSIYLLDKAIRPLPVGLSGEIYIGGDGLARGYSSQPELTAERFVPDPFSRKPGLRLYSTGDLARYREGGTIDFLGRSDHQVKIRGYRIEPGEIELALRECAGVQEAVVLAREASTGEMQLIAYYVGQDPDTPQASELKSALGQRLPEYMLPALFVRLDALPLTGSGKIDRRSLPAPEEILPADETTAVPFSSLVEEVVAEVFASAVGADSVSPGHNFFDIGGNSLSATRVVSKLRALFNVDLPLRKIFESPVVSELAGFIEDEIRGGAVVTPPTIVRRQRKQREPLSFAQQRIWFLTRLAASSPAYNISGAFKITGPLDADKLESCISGIIERHEVLRTGFEEIEGQPVQIIYPEAIFKLRRTELDCADPGDSCADPGGSPGRIRELAGQFSRNVFDLAKPPLVAGLLISTGESEHILVLSMHHIVSDGASVDIFFNEISITYAAGNDSPNDALPELNIQYADYAEWQHDWLRGDVLERQIAYWKSALAGSTGAIRLPADRPRPHTQTFNGSTVESAVSGEIAMAARRFGRDEGSTTFMTFLAAFHALLHKYSGQEDISVGIPVANRGLPQIQDLIGFFVNTVVVRAKIDRAAGFGTLMAQIRERAIEAYAHQEVPFEKLVDELQPERDLSRSPLFQVAFALSAPSRIPATLGALKLEEVEFESGTAKFDLFLFVQESADGLKVTFEYNRDLFNRSTIERAAQHFAVLTEAMLAKPGTPIREISLLSPAEEAQVLYGWNATELPGGQDRLFPELFEASVNFTPERVALVSGQSAVTYGALNQRCNRLATLLVESTGSFDTERPVAICLNRSVEMIVAMIAALKAGVPYLPLDPANPVDRIRSIIADSHATLAIIEPELASVLGAPGTDEVRLLPADQVNGQITNYSPRNLQARTFAERMAYMIYTSGSSGRPKGVAVEQRNLSNYVTSIIDRIAPDEGVSFAALSTSAADLGYTAVFPSLATRGCLHLIPEELFLDGEALAEYMECNPIGVLKIVPSHLAALQTAASPRNVMPSNTLLVGGEASDAGWVASLRESFPEVSVFNHYGPTETTVGVSTFLVDGAIPPTRGGIVPMGTPLKNSRLYLLSDDLQPVPVGVDAGVYIAGESVSRGYPDRPAATAEKFLPDPYSKKPGARMYASGDSGRRLSDGSIEFLGRRDDQVKIRGYRIELKEIEHAIMAHPGVAQAVVLASGGDAQANSAELSAYVVANPSRSRWVEGHERYLLPNNLAVAHLNKNETDYIYHEIFGLKAYLRFGTHLRDGSVVLDVGANIGLFTLFVAQQCQSAAIFSFEPNPSAFEKLKINASLYAPAARLFNCGLSNTDCSGEFTFFPGFTLFSGLYGDAETEKKVVKSFIANQAAASGVHVPELIEASDLLLDQRFQSQRFPVELRTLSDVIDEAEISRIDLLKINVEKSELDVLLGISERHWPRIAQIVMEVDLKDNLPRITDLLSQYGYQVNVFQDQALSGTELCYVYAKLDAARPNGNGAQKHGVFEAPALPAPFLTPDEIQVYLSEFLPDYMIPNPISVIRQIPLSANGKVDRQALRASLDSRKQLHFVPPGNATERSISTVWQEVLGIERVGVNDNFFAVGGNSLLLAQVCGRLRRTVNPAISVIELFRYPTIRSLATYLSGGQPSPLTDGHSPESRGADRRKASGIRAHRQNAARPKQS